MPSPDVLIAKIAARRFGVFTLMQALRCGFTQDMIDRRVAQGRWLRIHRGVYAINGSQPSLHRDALAASLAANGPVSHTTAGAVWEYGCAPAAEPEVLIAEARRVRVPGVTVRRTRELPRSDVTKRGVLPITSPVRTLLDLAAVLGPDDLEDALDAALNRFVRIGALEERLAEVHHGRPGIALLRRLVSGRSKYGPSGSLYENRVRRALVRAGLPEPVRQYVVRDDQGRFVARPDLSYPEARVYIEYDGGGHATPEQLEADDARQNRLSVAGWMPLRFTKGSFKDVDGAIVSHVRAVLRSRSRA